MEKKGEEGVMIKSSSSSSRKEKRKRSDIVLEQDKKRKVSPIYANPLSNYHRIEKDWNRKRKIKKEEEKEVFEPKWRFGQVDILPELEEVRDPEGGNKVEVANAPREMFDDEVQIISSTFDVQVFAHQRHECQKHAFHPENIFSTNHTTCSKCWCFVCDKPAKDCVDWWNPDRGSVADLRAHHCNAFPNLHWKVKKWLCSNPVQCLLMNLPNPVNMHGTVQERGDGQEVLYQEFQRVRGRIDRSWRLYEAGTIKVIPGKNKKEILSHDFKYVVSWFKKLFFATRMEKEEPKWISKFVILDAMTEIMISRTWRAPTHSNPEDEWDSSAENNYRRMMLSIGSRWLTCFALCHEENRLDLSKAIQRRVLHLKTLAKEPAMFNKGFSVILSLSKHGQYTQDAVEEVLRACSNLYRSVLRRKKQHLGLPNTGSNRAKWHEVVLKDSFMIPCLNAIANYNYSFCMGRDTGRQLFKRCEVLAKTCKFYEDPCVTHWKELFPSSRVRSDQENSDFLECFDFLKLSLDAKHTFSTRRAIKFKFMVKLTLCHLHIALRLEKSVSKEAFNMVNKSIGLLLEMANAQPTMQYILVSCHQMAKMLGEFFTSSGRRPIPHNAWKLGLYKMWPNLLRLLNACVKGRQIKNNLQVEEFMNLLKGSSSTLHTTYYVFEELCLMTNVLLGAAIRSLYAPIESWTRKALHRRVKSVGYWQNETVATKESYIRLKQYGKIMGISLSDIRTLLPKFKVGQLRSERDLIRSITACCRVITTDFSTNGSESYKIGLKLQEMNNRGAKICQIFPSCAHREVLQEGMRLASVNEIDVTTMPFNQIIGLVHKLKKGCRLRPLTMTWRRHSILL